MLLKREVKSSWKKLDTSNKEDNELRLNLLHNCSLFAIDQNWFGYVYCRSW